MTDAAERSAAGSPIRQLVLTTLLFVTVGSLIAGPLVIPVIWYFSLDDMTVIRAIISGAVVTVLGFWGIIAAGLIPAAAVGMTVGWLEHKYGITSIWVPVGAAVVFGGIWGIVIQSNVTEFVAVIPAILAGSVLASIACWRIMHWARALRARGRL